MMPLTDRQLDLLNYLKSCERCPSFVEMRDALGLTSKSGVHRLIEALEERGYIRRLPNRARAIELIDRPAPMAFASSLPAPGVVMVPLYGRIS